MALPIYHLSISLTGSISNHGSGTQSPMLIIHIYINIYYIIYINKFYKFILYLIYIYNLYKCILIYTT
jgi:hypothetical protein